MSHTTLHFQEHLNSFSLDIPEPTEATRSRKKLSRTNSRQMSPSNETPENCAFLLAQKEPYAPVSPDCKPHTHGPSIKSPPDHRTADVWPAVPVCPLAFGEGRGKYAHVGMGKP